jgi:hypothetical protein
LKPAVHGGLSDPVAYLIAGGGASLVCCQDTSHFRVDNDRIAGFDPLEPAGGGSDSVIERTRHLPPILLSNTWKRNGGLSAASPLISRFLL